MLSIFTIAAQDITVFDTQKGNDKVEHFRIDPEIMKASSKILAFANLFGNETSESDKEIIDLMTDLTEAEFLIAKNKDVHLLKN